MWASASFVGVLIVIGLPLWWKTTEVYRVALPYEKIGSFDKLPHKFTAVLSVLANDDATATEIAGLIENGFEGSDVITLKITKSVLSDEVHHTLSSVADEPDALEEIGATLDLGRHNQFYIVQRTPLFQDVWVGTERVAFFRDAKAAPTIVQVLKQWIYQTTILQGAKAETADAARRTRFPPGHSYHIVLSVVHPRPDVYKVIFDAKEAVEGAKAETADAARRTIFPPGHSYHIVLSVVHPRPDVNKVIFDAKEASKVVQKLDYVGTFVDELSILHNFTLKSQWLHFLDFDFKAKEVKDKSEWGRHFAIRQDRLPLLLTALEERAATHVSESPTINLALYAMPCSNAPAVIYDHSDKPVKSPVQAFMSPKWGGVVLSSPTAGDCRGDNPTHRPVVRHVMGAFVAQLRNLLGIMDYDYIQGAHLEPLRGVTPRRWETDSLLRTRTLEQVTSAERTLQSLAQLLGEISNIVINDEVGASINLAVQSIQEATELMKEGKLVDAYKTSQRAFNASETAFMEPSLLALLYFPDDQKYAIYIPLFLPIMFPVVLSLKKLLLWFRGKQVHKKQD